MSKKQSYMNRNNLLGEGFFSALKNIFKGRKVGRDPKIQSNIKKMNDNFESIEQSLQNIENRLEKEHGIKARKVKLPRFTSKDFFK